MSHLKIFTMLLVFNIPIILSGDIENVLETNPDKVIKEYNKAKFEFFKNPWTLYYRFGLEPTCNFFRKTVRTICVRLYNKLKNEIKGIASLKETSENFSYGCYQFKIIGTDRVQRVNRCPFALENGDNIFLSFCFTKSNSYFWYAATELSKKGFKIDKKNLKEAKLIALASAGKTAPYVWTKE